MNFIILKKEEIKQLEHETIRVENLFTGMSKIQHEKCCHLILGIQFWYNTQKLTTKDSQKTHNKRLSQLLNNEPSYYVNYEYRNAVWGFSFENDEKIAPNNKVVIYHDKRGLSIQVHPKFRKDSIENLLKELFNLLVDKTNISIGLGEILKDVYFL